MKRVSITHCSVMLLLVLTVAVVACAHGQSAAASQSGASRTSDSSQAATGMITIDNFSFTPHELKVPTGTKLTWTNHDDIPHTVVNTDQRFKSKALDTDESFSFTFDEPGTYEYFCSLHPKMVGKIIVEGKK